MGGRSGRVTRMGSGVGSTDANVEPCGTATVTVIRATLANAVQDAAHWQCAVWQQPSPWPLVMMDAAAACAMCIIAIVGMPS